MSFVDFSIPVSFHELEEKDRYVKPKYTYKELVSGELLISSCGSLDIN